ncbi:heavy-metal-associated domain-containing protein [Flavobacterium aciduliphilum]|uniref:Copper chaperone CopZ n=1 Tax=Flavobacterium aciduliphilum TaxID=1101402 RepID=A0A328YDC7_9FLAO|nr:heavy-metal-associated domain-containing protein [Flavobacterium aciduliphilum]RAR70112.1 copper chaperone CopZ [Flavobacterium aciduliphilum]
MKTKLIVQNLKCGGCAKTISSKIAQVGSISEIEVVVDESSVSFSYDNESTLEKVVEVLKTNGYPVEGDSNTMTTKAKSFVSCAIGKMS